MKKYLILFVLICSFNFASVILTGFVTDKDDNEILIGANIVIIQNEEQKGSSTNELGKYTINDIGIGKYSLIASYIGYDNFKKDIIVTQETPEIYNIDITLEVSSLVIDEYVVTASRGRKEKITDAPAAISIISERKIRTASNPNLGDYFKNIKGVDFTASGLDSYNLSARGFNSSFSSRLLTLTDGRMAQVPSLRLIAYNVIPLSSDDVEQIEVVLGPSSALYGPNAHAGVVNIISKTPQQSLGTVIGLTGGSRNFKKMQIRHSNKIGNLGLKLSMVNFSANDWELIEEDEKKSHYYQWESDLGDGDIIDDWFDNGQAWWDDWDILVDKDGDGKVDTTYFGKDNIIKDRNDDGIDDIPVFDIKNQRFDLRADYEFSEDHFISGNFGVAKANNINITGVGRYLADDWIYSFYQFRWIYKNFFSQAYLNSSESGDTRNLRTGVTVIDKSKFFHYQFQHSFDVPLFLKTKVIWGGDYQRTMPETFGTILPDGTGGRNPISYGRDGKDNDGDAEIDEWDELIVTNEYGLYAQSQSKLNDYFELILSGRLDLHSGQLDKNGISFLDDPIGGGSIKYVPQTSPKVGLLYKPSENHTFRLTAARAFNTPSSQGLYLNLKAAQYSVFEVKARGNKDGYNYIRDEDDRLLYYNVELLSEHEFKLTHIPDDYVLLLPPVLGRPATFVNPEDYRYIKPVRSEEVWTYEIGFAGLLNKRVRGTLDLYYSQYSDFVSDLTWVTPVVVDTSLGYYSVENPDPIVKGVVPLLETANIDPGDDGRFGTDDDVIPQPPDLVFTNINYGDVEIWGLDGSVFVFLDKNFSTNISFSYLGTTSFYNFLTREYDPINAPQYKINGTLTYMPELGFNWNIGMRVIPEFEWASGVHYGKINAYNVFDVALGYNFNKSYGLLLNVNNLTNNLHNEIIGGPDLGRHLTLKLTARF